MISIPAIFLGDRDGATGYRNNGVRSDWKRTPTLRHPRTPLQSLAALFTGHLKHGPAGNLIHNANGNLVNACAASSGNCPLACSECTASYPLTVAGVGGTGAVCCITPFDGTYTLNRIANNCQWATGVFYQSDGCTFGWELYCTKVDCNNVPGPPRWVIEMYGSIGYVWAENFTPSLCPPAGVYTICLNLCSGGMGTSIILG